MLTIFINQGSRDSISRGIICRSHLVVEHPLDGIAIPPLAPAYSAGERMPTVHQTNANGQVIDSVRTGSVRKVLVDIQSSS